MTFLESSERLGETSERILSEKFEIRYYLHKGPSLEKSTSYHEFPQGKISDKEIFQTLCDSYAESHSDLISEEKLRRLNYGLGGFLNKSNCQLVTRDDEGKVTSALLGLANQKEKKFHVGYVYLKKSDSEYVQNKATIISFLDSLEDYSLTTKVDWFNASSLKFFEKRGLGVYEIEMRLK